jgi:hypothetical protein
MWIEDGEMTIKMTICHQMSPTQNELLCGMIRPPRADLFQWCFGDHIPGQAGLVQHDVAGLQHKIGEFSTGFRIVLDDGCEIVPKCLKLQDCNKCGP